MKPVYIVLAIIAAIAFFIGTVPLWAKQDAPRPATDARKELSRALEVRRQACDRQIVVRWVIRAKDGTVAMAGQQVVDGCTQ